MVLYSQTDGFENRCERFENKADGTQEPECEGRNQSAVFSKQLAVFSWQSAREISRQFSVCRGCTIEERKAIRLSSYLADKLSSMLHINIQQNLRPFHHGLRVDLGGIVQSRSHQSTASARSNDLDFLLL